MSVIWFMSVQLRGVIPDLQSYRSNLIDSSKSVFTSPSFSNFCRANRNVPKKLWMQNKCAPDTTLVSSIYLMSFYCLLCLTVFLPSMGFELATPPDEKVKK